MNLEDFTQKSIEQETIAKIREQLKDFGNKKMRALKQLNDDSWVVEMMGCDQRIVTAAFDMASHDYSELDNGTAQNLVLIYVDGMSKCKGCLDEGIDAYDGMYKFISGVTNCFAQAYGYDESTIDGDDKLYTVWIIRLICNEIGNTSLWHNLKADTSTVHPKQPKGDCSKGDAPKSVPDKPSLINKWADKFKAADLDLDIDIATLLIEKCTTEICMYIFENMSDTNILGEMFAYALPSDIKDFISKVSKAISNPSSAVEKILTDTQGFAAQLCEFARLLGCPDWMEIDNLVKPDITQDSAKYEYESPKSGLMDLLNNMYGGDVIEYIKSGV